jgi:hypothetical protein
LAGVTDVVTGAAMVAYLESQACAVIDNGTTLSVALGTERANVLFDRHGHLTDVL